MLLQVKPGDILKRNAVPGDIVDAAFKLLIGHVLKVKEVHPGAGVVVEVLAGEHYSQGTELVLNGGTVTDTYFEVI